MAEKKPKKAINPEEKKGFKIDPKWKKKPDNDQTMDGLGISFEEAMKALSNPNPPENKN